MLDPSVTNWSCRNDVAEIVAKLILRFENHQTAQTLFSSYLDQVLRVDTEPPTLLGSVQPYMWTTIWHGRRSLGHEWHGVVATLMPVEVAGRMV